MSTDDYRYHTYTAPIVREAERRGIRVEPIPAMGPAFAMLTYRGHRELIIKSATDRNGMVTAKVLNHKGASMDLLAEAGYPVPPTAMVDSVSDALPYLGEWTRVVTKPPRMALGIGVTVGIADEKALEGGIKLAKNHTRRGKPVVVQKQVEGREYRVLVVDKRRVFGTERVPPFVTGDGEHTIAELIEEWNLEIERRGRKIKPNERVQKFIAKSGWTLDTVPPARAMVQLHGLANSSQGGFTYDVTEELCPEVVEIVRGIAEDFDASYLGCDFISEDIMKTPGQIIEVNPDAGISIHEDPTYGRPRSVCRAIIDMLFPETAR